MELTGLIEIRTEYGESRLRRGDAKSPWLFSFGAEARYVRSVEGLTVGRVLLLDGSRSGTVQGIEILPLPEVFNALPEPRVGDGDRLPTSYRAEARIVKVSGEDWVSGRAICQQRDVVQFKTSDGERLWLPAVDVRA